MLRQDPRSESQSPASPLAPWPWLLEARDWLPRPDFRCRQSPTGPGQAGWGLAETVTVTWAVCQRARAAQEDLSQGEINLPTSPRLLALSPTCTGLQFIRRPQVLISCYQMMKMELRLEAERSSSLLPFRLHSNASSPSPCVLGNLGLFQVLNVLESISRSSCKSCSGCSGPG